MANFHIAQNLLAKAGLGCLAQHAIYCSNGLFELSYTTSVGSSPIKILYIYIYIYNQKVL